MPLVNFTAREITCKLVYYGPGRCGKTTNLQYIHGRVPESRRGRMVSLATQADRTLFFDFLPIELGVISGFTTRFQLYTVPGQVYYNATRRLVLQGADGVVFVADSQARRFDENVESFQNLQENLLEQSVDIRQLPLVLQYNKQDLPSDLVLTPDEMDEAFNFRSVPSLAADALHGTGVFETLKALSTIVLQRLAARPPDAVTDPFASLVPDPATRAAVAAARMVAESPRGHLLLLITGARGSGKTHLLRAIRDRAAGATPPRQVELVTLGRLAEHVQSRGLADAGVALRDRLLRAEIVLLDDLEVIERQLAVQAFVFDVLESRLAAGLATVVTAARGLSQLTGLDARLVRRLRDASTVEIGLPGPAARAQILDQRITEAGHNLLPGVVTALAEAELGSVKEYLGALNRILAVQETTPTPIPVDDALALVGLERTVPVPGHDGGVESQGYAAGEFDEFLTEVVANVSEQFDHWRGRLRDAVALWQGAGMRTGRLERLLADEGPGDPEPVLEAFERDANELVRLAAEVAALAPDLAGADLLRDPDQLVAARRLVNEARTRRAPLSAPLPDLTLATIGTGASNRVALETLAAIVAEPGARHNPLVLAGPSGVGKTHLLHGLGNALAHRGLAPIACLSAHSLLGELSSLSTPEETAQWRARYQWVAALLIDDIHLLANEPRAHAELLQIYAALEEGGRPMVFTSSRALSDLAGFDPRLLNRLEGGTVVDVRSPDREVRLAVVRSLLAGTPAANDVGLIDYLAGRPADSVRAVQGIVHRVLVEAEAAHTIASAALARETLDTVEGKAPRRERRPIGARSGILSPGMGVVRSPEKMVQVWPVAGERLLTELG